MQKYNTNMRMLLACKDIIDLMPDAVVVSAYVTVADNKMNWICQDPDTFTVLHLKFTADVERQLVSYTFTDMDTDVYIDNT